MKRDKLTQSVIDYKKRSNNQLLRTIMKKSEGLIYTVLKYYHIDYFPGIIQEELIEEGKSIVLLRAIGGFEPLKGCRFSTYYTWKLKSYIHGKQDYYLKRKKIVESKSLESPIKDQLTLGDNLTNWDSKYHQKCKKKIRNIFGM